MEEWFGKKGISNHVNCFVLRNHEKKLMKATFLHLLTDVIRIWLLGAVYLRMMSNSSI